MKRNVLDVGRAGLDVRAKQRGKLLPGAGGDLPVDKLREELAEAILIVLVSNAGAFAQRYGAIPIAGQYTGNLSHGGESLKLEDVDGGTIHDFAYDDTGEGWHPSTDGGGFSLTIVDATLAADAWNVASSWRPSYGVGGSPGGIDTLPGDFNGDLQVNLIDLAILQAHLGTTSGASASHGDINGDGAVDRRDVSAFAKSYGSGAEALPAAAAAWSIRAQAAETPRPRAIVRRPQSRAVDAFFAADSVVDLELTIRRASVGRRAHRR